VEEVVVGEELTLLALAPVSQNRALRMRVFNAPSVILHVRQKSALERGQNVSTTDAAGVVEFCG